MDKNKISIGLKVYLSDATDTIYTIMDLPNLKDMVLCQDAAGKFLDLPLSKLSSYDDWHRQQLHQEIEDKIKCLDTSLSEVTQYLNSLMDLLETNKISIQYFNNKNIEQHYNLLCDKLKKLI
jgi:DNA gyrase/topoisomerase IV subunit A